MLRDNKTANIFMTDFRFDHNKKNYDSNDINISGKIYVKNLNKTY